MSTRPVGEREIDVKPERTKRNVKLGKITLRWWCPVAHHWAVQVDDGGMWYEVDHKGGGGPFSPLPAIKIKRTMDNARKGCCWEPKGFKDCCSDAEAGCCGGEIVGETEMTDEEIEVFIVHWKATNKNYFVAGNNCIKFGYEFMDKLTDGYFSIYPSSLVATNASDNSRITDTCTCMKASGPGCTVLARRGAGDNRFIRGPFGIRARLGPEFKAEAVAGPGLGLFLDASCGRVEGTLGLPWLGIQLHTDINMNTGLGARNGNMELHLLGFGFKVGLDGLEVNTPWIGGYNIGALVVVLFFVGLSEILPGTEARFWKPWPIVNCLISGVMESI